MERVTSVAFSPDAPIIALALMGLMVRLWDLETGIQSTLKGDLGRNIGFVTFSPNGKLVAAVSAFAICL